jgi:tetratricopeptide (TPR) repeat protein
MALSRGQARPETWERLHEAAMRDGRLSELAFAYEAVSQGRRMRTMSPQVMAEFLYRAGTFFAGAFGDETGAAAYLERALAAMPTHPGAFEQLEAALTRRGELRRVAELYTTAAQHRAKADQTSLLRRAAALYEQVPGADERAVEIYQQLLRLDPSDEGSRGSLESRYLRANRHRDVARLLEQALAVDPPPPEEGQLRLRTRLIELYDGQLQEPERSMPHIEAVLAKDPPNENARRVALKLLNVKGLASRAAAALAEACDKWGHPEDVARFLAIELEHTRGPKRFAVLRRIGLLRQDRLKDPTGAYEAFEAALALDPSDDQVRERYAGLCVKLGRALDGARTLTRVGTAAREPHVRARLNAAIGELLREGGDLKRARAQFVAILATSQVDELATLRAAHALVDIYTQEADSASLADVLQRIAVVDLDPERRLAASEQLAHLAQGILADPHRAIGAWRQIVAAPPEEAGERRERALAALEPLYEAERDAAELAFVLEERAKITKDKGKARAIMFRAATVLTTLTTEVVRASHAWKQLVDRYGASRDALEQWIPLLESQRAWADLAQALAADAQLAPESERAAIWARLAHVRLQRTNEKEAAIEAFKQALAVDPHEKSSRTTLEKLLTIGENRLAAGAVLEPIYRSEGNQAGLLRVLELRAGLGASVEDRLAALDEAIAVSEPMPSTQPRALEFAGRALAEAVSGGEPLEPWLLKFERHAGTADPKKRAQLLAKALGDKPVASDELAVLARRAGEALASCGDVAGALSAYKRALAYAPSNAELIARVDDLLREQGSPRERVALYRAALDRGVDKKRRRELLHTIGQIEREDLKSPKAAVEAYVAALEDDPDDRDAQAALVELLTELGAWEELCDLLDRLTSRASIDEARRTRAQLAEIAAAHGQSERAESECRILLADAGTEPHQLEAVERVAKQLNDPELAYSVYVRRSREADDPREQIAWLEKLATLQAEKQRDTEGAIATWKQAARVAAHVGDDELGLRLWARVRALVPDDAESAEGLARLLERGEKWAELPDLIAVLLQHATEPKAKVALEMRLSKLRAEKLGDAAGAVDAAARAFSLDPRDRDVLAWFEKVATSARAGAVFARKIDDAILKAPQEGRVSERPEQEGANLRADLLMSKARVTGADPARYGETADAFRAVLGMQGLDDGRARAAITAFESLVTSKGAPGVSGVSPDVGVSPDHIKADRRWLCEWRFEHAPAEERVPALAAWANAEEMALGDGARALELYRKVLELDAENSEAMAAISRLALAGGDVEGAIRALVSRRDRSEGTARSALDLEIAAILLDRTERLAEALDCVASVLESAPSDAAALQLGVRFLGHASTRARAIEVLGRAYESAEDTDVRMQILEALIGAADSSGAPHELRKDWYERLLGLLREKGDVHKAHEIVLRAAAELPTVASLWDRAEALARELKSPNDVAELFQRALAKPLAREDALELGQRAVAFYEEWFEEPERIIAILERILEIDPTESWAFDRLKLLFDSSERWDDLFKLYDRALLAADDAKKIELLEDAAQIAKDFANHSKRAIGYLEQLLALKPGNARLAASLERLYERHGCHRELIALLTTQLSSLTPEDAQESRVRIAKLWLEEVGDATQALLVVEDMVAREPGGNPRGVDVTSLLERILAKAPATSELRESIAPAHGGYPPAPSVPALMPNDSTPPRRDSFAPPTGAKRTLVRQRAAALLKDRYAEKGRDRDLVRILEVELEVVKSVRERIKRHAQIAQLYSALGDDGQAMEHYTSLVLLEPDVAEHRTKLADIAAKIGRHDRLAEVLASAAEDCTDDALRVDLLMQAAVVHAWKLDEPDRAIELFFRILLISPIGEVPLLTACRRVEPLLEKAGRKRERLDVLERLALIEPEADTRRNVLGTAARLATELGENDRAVWAWEGRLKGDPKDPDALNGLVGILEREKRWRPLIEALRARASADVPGADKRTDRVRVATILSEKLQETDEAIASWREVEAEFGDSEESTRALALLLRSARKWAELAQLLERAASRASDTATRSRLLRELGDVQRENLDQAGGAIESYKGSLAADPKCEEARSGLRLLLARAEHRAAAVAVLLDAYRATDEWRLSLDLTEHRLFTAPDEAAKVQILMEVAQIAEKRAFDNEDAFAAIRRAFLLSPGDTQIDAELMRLAGATRQWRSLAEAQREALENVEAMRKQPEWGPSLRYQMGEVLETRLDDPRSALIAYARVSADAPERLDAARATIRVAARVMRWDVAGKAIVEVSRAANELPEELALAVEDAATTPAAWDAATIAFAQAVEERADLQAEVARDLEARIATWHRDRRGDADSAEAAFTRALSHDATNAELLAQLAHLQRRQRGRPLVETLLRLSSATGGDLDLLREAAETAAGPVGDRALAKSILERLLKLGQDRWIGSGDTEPVTSGGPLSPSTYVEWALRELVRIHNDENDAERVLELLSNTSRLPFAQSTSRAMRHEAARIATERLADTERAIELLAALFDENPDDAEAVSQLVALYTTHGRVADLLDLKRKQIKAATTAPKRIELRLESAPLLLQRGDVEACVAVLRENLAEDPRDGETVDELVRVLEKEKRYAELGTLLADQATLAEEAGEPEEAAELWARTAAIAEERLQNIEQSIDYYKRVIALEPRASALAALARLSSTRSDFAGAADYLERLRALADPKERSAITLRLADALALANKGDVARARLEEASDEDPDSEEVRARLSEIYRTKQEWRPLAQLLTRGAEHAPDKATRLSRLREAAELYRARCNDPAAAVPLLERASDLDPEDRTIRMSLGDALGASGRFEEARSLLRALIDGFAGRRPKERAPVHYHLARLDLALGDRARALVELDQATKIDPANPEILRALAELARDDGQLERAERSYRALLAVLRRHDDTQEGSILRAEVLLELSGIADRQGQTDRAKEILESALEIATENDVEGRRLEKRLREREDWATLVRALEARLARADDAAALADLASVLDDKLGRKDDALRARLRAIALSPISAELHDAALALARRENAVGKYVDHVQELVWGAEGRNDSSQACELLLRLGAVVELELKDDTRAAQLYERAQEYGGKDGPHVGEVLKALDRVYERLGDAQAQARVLSARV